MTRGLHDILRTAVAIAFAVGIGLSGCGGTEADLPPCSETTATVVDQMTEGESPPTPTCQPNAGKADALYDQSCVDWWIGKGHSPQTAKGNCKIVY